ncbi:MAG: cytochrome c-type biogenesis protein [Chloroflexota bacterium]
MRYLTRTVAILLLLLLASTALAQSDTPDDPVTDDAVNAVAEQLYCPVCENIPLDACGIAACVDWRNEIRLMLADGFSEQTIIDDFVRRFGDRVVGTPQDPVLRALSVWTPWLAVAAGLLGLGWLALRWSGGRSGDTHVLDRAGDPAAEPLTEADWYAQLEDDVKGR